MDVIEKFKTMKGQYLAAKQRETLRRKEVGSLTNALCDELLSKHPHCRKCGRTEHLTIDHIIPKIILVSFGVDTELDFFPDNFQVLCRPCNQFKSGRLDFSIPETKQLLLKLLERV